MSKKYRVRTRRGIPWVLLAVIALAVYLYFFYDTGEYSIYLVGLTIAVVLIWLYRFLRRKNVTKDYDSISRRLDIHHNERVERDDYNVEVKNYTENQNANICEFCGATQSKRTNICENCGKNLS